MVGFHVLDEDREADAKDVGLHGELVDPVRRNNAFPQLPHRHHQHRKIILRDGIYSFGVVRGGNCGAWARGSWRVGRGNVRNLELRKSSEELITSSSIRAEGHVSFNNFGVVGFLRLVVVESVWGMSTKTLKGSGSRQSYLLSPLEGRPIDSKGSRFTGLRRLHGTELLRPPREDIVGECLRVLLCCVYLPPSTT